MRHKEEQVKSTKEEQLLLEKYIKKYKCLYNVGLEFGISETSLWKYRNGYEQGKTIKNKITNVLIENKG